MSVKPLPGSAPTLVMTSRLDLGGECKDFGEGGSVGGGGGDPGPSHVEVGFVPRCILKQMYMHNKLTTCHV